MRYIISNNLITVLVSKRANLFTGGKTLAKKLYSAGEELVLMIIAEPLFVYVHRYIRLLFFYLEHERSLKGIHLIFQNYGRISAFSFHSGGLYLYLYLLCIFVYLCIYLFF